MVIPMRSSKYPCIVFLWVWVPTPVDNTGRFLGAFCGLRSVLSGSGGLVT